MTSEGDLFVTQSREGYFGDPKTAVTKSNAGDEPRIILDPAYGQNDSGPSQASLRLLGLNEESVRSQLAGCADRYAGKAVVVTGGARGIGEGCVRVFYEAGSDVVIADRDEAGGELLASELRAFGRANRVIFVRTDVSVTAQLQSLVDAAVEAFGRLDCVVNNAGWHPPHKPVDDFSIEEAQDLMQLNFISVFALCKYALPHLRKTKGNIINMSSWVGAFGQAKATTYAATKGATTAFTKALAIDEAAHGVRVNSVSPGNVWTPLWKAGADAEPDPVAAQQAGSRVQALGRMGTVLEAGRLCLCVAADMSFTTGVDHIMSGGAEIGYGMK